MRELLPELDLDRCPHCGVAKPLLRSVHEQLIGDHANRNRRHWRMYSCSSCGGVVTAASKSEKGEVIEIYPATQAETFETEHLPQAVQSDFVEALKCFTIGCYNAFGAMVRRTVQSAAIDLGAEGTSKVQNQIEALMTAEIGDTETLKTLRQIIIDCHDGVHPHLPALNSVRAALLLELSKDVLYQLYVRKAKRDAAIAERNKAIEGKKL